MMPCVKGELLFRGLVCDHLCSLSREFSVTSLHKVALIVKLKD